MTPDDFDASPPYSLADDVTPPNDDTPAPPAVRVLRDVTPALREERAPEAAGGVPLPDWPMVRALVGGATARDVEMVGQAGGGDVARAAARVAAARTLGAFLPAGLHVVTGTTGGGKTALVVNLTHAAATGGHPVLYVTLELDAEEIAARLAALVGAGAWWTLAQHRAPATHDARAARDAALASLDDTLGDLVHVLALDGTCDDPCAAITHHAMRLWHTHRRAPLVVLDYLQLLTVRQGNGYRAPLREAITGVTVALRTLSRRGTAGTADTWPGCPVVVLSTTARGNVKGADAISGLTGGDPDELRKVDEETLKALPKEAGEIEATAVSAWVLALGAMPEDGHERPLALRLAKYRYGPAGGWVPFAFDAGTQTMREDPTRYGDVREKDAAVTREKAAERKKKKDAAKERDLAAAAAARDKAPFAGFMDEDED